MITYQKVDSTSVVVITLFTYTLKHITSQNTFCIDVTLIPLVCSIKKSSHNYGRTFHEWSNDWLQLFHIERILLYDTILAKESATLFNKQLFAQDRMCERVFKRTIVDCKIEIKQIQTK